MTWRIGYQLALWIILPWVLGRLWWRGMREPGYRVAWRERFGRYEAAAFNPHALRTIWVHAVSLGEMNAAKPLIQKLLARFPQDRILLTQMTATGRQAAMEFFGDRVIISWIPYDYPFAISGFIEHFNPAIGIFVETEVWFNLVEACNARSIPIVLANGRLSEKSYRGYMKIGPLARRAFGLFDAIAAQTAMDAARYSQLGAKAPIVMGNLKFDAAVASGAAPLQRTFRERYGDRPVFIAASTRDGEEDLLLHATASHPLAETLFVIVPRHPDRFDTVADLMKKRGLFFVRRSSNLEVPGDCRYVLGDSVGEMGAYFGSSDVAFIGGSLLDYGGQNLIEACAAGVPVLIGPHTRNFEEAARLAIEAGAALRVGNADEVVLEAARLLSDPGARAHMAEAGRAFCALHIGAADRLVDIVADLLPHTR